MPSADSRERAGRSAASPSQKPASPSQKPASPSQKAGSPARKPALPSRAADGSSRFTGGSTLKPAGPAGGEERLQKVLAAAGIGSRRACEELIAAGRVTVGDRVARLGDKADPASAEIYIDGERVVADTRLVYLAMNKPRGVVATMADEKGRIAVADYLGSLEQRVYHVGRLDADSEGLLLLTNDGALAHKLMHPSYEVAKTYLCEVPGPVPRQLGRQLLAGVELDDGPVKVDAYKMVDAVGRTALLEIVLHEGRKHIVRRLLAELGHPVDRLIRTAIGPIRLGDLKSGRTRRLSNPEVAALFKAVAN